MITWHSKYFQPSEVLSIDGMHQLSLGNQMISNFTLAKLDDIRELLGSSILINIGQFRNRGYRSVNENIKAGGGVFSRHPQGIAFDCTPPKSDIYELAVIAIGQGWGGIGLYPKNNFVHIDLRSNVNDRLTVWVKTDQDTKSIFIEPEDYRNQSPQDLYNFLKAI